MYLWLWIYLAAVLVMSIVAFAAYGLDKRKAERGAWRTPEAVLLGLGVLLGALGAIVGMKVFHHKTRHWYFWAANIASLLLHIAIPVAVAVAVLL